MCGFTTAGTHTPTVWGAAQALTVLPINGVQLDSDLVSCSGSPSDDGGDLSDARGHARGDPVAVGAIANAVRAAPPASAGGASAAATACAPGGWAAPHSTTRVAASDKSITSRIDHIAAVAVAVHIAVNNATIAATTAAIVRARTCSLQGPVQGI